MSVSFVPGSACIAITEVELSISARELPCEDFLSFSDPLCVTYVQQLDTKNWREFHRTETIRETQNPDFVSKVQIRYNFEEQQLMKFELYDTDEHSKKLKDHHFIGFATCSLAQIVSNGMVKLPLQKKNFDGSVHTCSTGFFLINVEELASSDDDVVLLLSGVNLDKKDFFGKSDPYIEIHKLMATGEYTPVHKTEVVKNTLNPHWKRLYVPMKTLCNGDYNRSLKFMCWDWNMDVPPSFIGEFTTTLGEISSGNARFSLINPKKVKKKPNYKNSGEIVVEHFEIYKVHSFMDYLRGGLQLHCTIAIDFAESVGNRKLHQISTDGTLNSYEQAITSIVSILQDYDSDKQFPVLGFGARIPPSEEKSHEFYVNMTSSPYCLGVNGVLDAYRNCIRQVKQVDGCTKFSPVIEHVMKFAEAYKDGNHYFILLILTKGEVSDMGDTLKAIVAASALPISIIIVGVGHSCFDFMEKLDADDKLLKSWDGIKADRDIVQFVPLKKFLSLGDPSTAKFEVLAEIPKQLVTYMKYNRIEPGPPRVNPIDLPPNPGPI